MLQALLGALQSAARSDEEVATLARQVEEHESSVAMLGVGLGDEAELELKKAQIARRYAEEIAAIVGESRALEGPMHR